MTRRRLLLLLFVLIYVVLYIFFSGASFPHIDEVDVIDTSIEFSLVVFSYILLAGLQWFNGPRKVYSYLTIGVTLFVFYHVSDMMDEIVIYPLYLQYFADDVSHLFALIFILIGIFHWVKHNNRMLLELQKLATIDGLTGVYNRQQIDAILEDMCESASRYDKDLSVVILDIDHFKEVNDQYGHATGDEVLKKMSNMLCKEVRVTDRFGRYGGEEFLLLLPETTLEGARTAAEKLRFALNNFDFGSTPRVTASFGVASYRKGEDLADLVHRADIGLYKSKESGRNCVTVSP